MWFETFVATDVGQTTANNVGSTVRKEFDASQKFFSTIVAIFLMSTALFNVIKATTGIELVPPFEESYNGVRDFLHTTMKILFFDWFFGLCEQLIYLGSLALGPLNIQPMRLSLSVPSWYLDMSVVSIAVARAGLRSRDILGTDYHNKFDKTSREYLKKQFGFLSIFLIILHAYAEYMLKLANFFAIFVVGLVRGLHPGLANNLGEAVYLLVRGVSMGGVVGMAASFLYSLAPPRSADDDTNRYIIWQLFLVLLSVVASGIVLWRLGIDLGSGAR